MITGVSHQHMDVSSFLEICMFLRNDISFSPMIDFESHANKIKTLSVSLI
jgi:hypothetical protein